MKLTYLTYMILTTYAFSNPVLHACALNDANPEKLKAQGIAVFETHDFKSSVAAFQQLLRNQGIDYSSDKVTCNPDINSLVLADVFYYLGQSFMKLASETIAVDEKLNMKKKALTFFELHAHRLLVDAPADKLGRFDVFPEAHIEVLLFCLDACGKDVSFFAKAAPRLHAAFAPLTVADADGDGKQNVIFLSRSRDPSDDYAVVVCSLTGQAILYRFESPRLERPSRIVVKDTDKDGLPEIILEFEGMLNQTRDKAGMLVRSKKCTRATVLQVSGNEINCVQWMIPETQLSSLPRENRDRRQVVTQEAEERSTWLTPGLIAAAIVLAGIVLFLLLRRKHKTA